VRISKDRGKLLQNQYGDTVRVTIHPSAIYRQRGKSEREKEYRHFLADIKAVRSHLVGRTS
jgi:hypothetical protein